MSDHLPDPDDKRMWRLLLARAHPDAGGEHELFLWTKKMHESVTEMVEKKRNPPFGDHAMSGSYVHPGGVTFRFTNARGPSFFVDFGP